MDFENIATIKQQDFSDFITVSCLRESACRQAPEEAGVYLVIWPGSEPPVFLEHGTGGHFKGENPEDWPDVSIDILQSAWVSGASVVYIGQATDLRSRLRLFMRFGAGHPVAHWGGRYIWQIADAADLLVCWKATPDEVPRAVERRLIQEFRTRYGKRPFANLKD